jgi:hypothetical protein
MKVRVSSVLVTFAAFFLMALSAKAQEELPVLEPLDPNHSHQELNLGEDKVLLIEHSTHSSQSKDTVQTAARPAAVSAKASRPDTHKAGPKEREGEDALSFNFLYYMFQKFKMSDLVDHR